MFESILSISGSFGKFLDNNVLSGPNSGMHPICICYTHRDLFLVRVLFPKHQIDDRRRGGMREGEERGVRRGMRGQRNP